LKINTSLELTPLFSYSFYAFFSAFRAKVAKRNMIHPCTDDDDLPLSPSLNFQYEADTVVLLTRAKEKYVCKVMQDAFSPNFS